MAFPQRISVRGFLTKSQGNDVLTGSLPGPGNLAPVATSTVEIAARKSECRTEARSGNSPESCIRLRPAKRRYMLFLPERQHERELAHFLLDKLAYRD